MIASKLKALKQYIIVWNREVIWNVSTNKKVTLNHIGLWHAKGRDSSLSLEETEASRRVVEDFNKWANIDNYG